MSEFELDATIVDGNLIVSDEAAKGAEIARWPLDELSQKISLVKPLDGEGAVHLHSPEFSRAGTRPRMIRVCEADTSELRGVLQHFKQVPVLEVGLTTEGPSAVREQYEAAAKKHAAGKKSPHSKVFPVYVNPESVKGVEDRGAYRVMHIDSASELSLAPKSGLERLLGRASPSVGFDLEG